MVLCVDGKEYYSGIFFPFQFLIDYSNIHNIKFTLLTLSVQLDGIKYIHTVVQP